MAKKKKSTKKKAAKKKVVRKKSTAKKKVSPIPEGYGTVTASLKQNGAAATIAFCEAAFGAKVKGKLEGPSGIVMHAQMKIGDSVLHVGEAMGGQALASSIMLYVKNVDQAVEKAVAAGAKILMPIENMFWGDRYALLQDPQGNFWEIASRFEIVSNAEMKKRSHAFVQQMAGA